MKVQQGEDLCPRCGELLPETIQYTDCIITDYANYEDEVMSSPIQERMTVEYVYCTACGEVVELAMYPYYD